MDVTGARQHRRDARREQSVRDLPEQESRPPNWETESVDQVRQRARATFCMLKLNVERRVPLSVFPPWRRRTWSSSGFPASK